MPKQTKLTPKPTNGAFWIVVALIAQLITAPSFSINKLNLDVLDPTTYNTLRSALGALVALPFLLWYWRRLNRRNLLYALGAGCATAVAVTLTSYALKDSQASYVSLMSLLSPIVLVVYSSVFFHEKVRLRAAAGITLAALGALLAVALPLVIGGHTSLTLYPLATGLIFLASVFLPLAIILLRKANEAGLPLTSSQGISGIVVMLASYAASLALHAAPVNVHAIGLDVWLGIAYNAIFVIFIARIFTTASYERVGGAIISGLNYLGIILSLLIPIIFLHERLSLAMIIGGVLILTGVYLTERHHAINRHALHFWRHHPPVV